VNRPEGVRVTRAIADFTRWRVTARSNHCIFLGLTSDGGHVVPTHEAIQQAAVAQLDALEPFDVGDPHLAGTTSLKVAGRVEAVRSSRTRARPGHRVLERQRAAGFCSYRRRGSSFALVGGPERDLDDVVGRLTSSRFEESTGESGVATMPWMRLPGSQAFEGERLLARGRATSSRDRLIGRCTRPSTESDQLAASICGRS
jgi:hypothetical protein